METYHDDKVIFISLLISISHFKLISVTVQSTVHDHTHDLFDIA
jgi:hypothetical protein